MSKTMNFDYSRNSSSNVDEKEKRNFEAEEIY
jgi:hypothetical protein